ncbi:MAG TPA: hypothetical protein VGQ34_11050 [Sphingomicrobium sp.]|jgi:hypothetical protein|nr:hypothetical protein [Sphingomicrobium sp.]
MRKVLVTSILALCSAPAAAAASAHCDATPFTLGKPAAAVPKAQNDQPKPKPAPQAVPAAAKKLQAKSEGKQRLLASCKAGKSKKKSG